MERLTTYKEVFDMSMNELAHNSCYAKDRKARYRDYNTDIDARELTRQLLRIYANVDEEDFVNDEDFDALIYDCLQYGTDTIIGLIALFYRNLWAMADLRERLKYYEDLAEKGLFTKLPEKGTQKGMSLKSVFTCEKCGLEQMFVIDSRKSEKGFIQRKRKCGNCGHRISTYEFHADDYEKLEV